MSIPDRMFSRPWPNGASLPAMDILAKKMTDEWVPTLTALAPDSGCYMSEVKFHYNNSSDKDYDLRMTPSPVADYFLFQADPYQPDWKQAFYGSNYQDLYSIKKKYDPDHVFYAPTAVGSDQWKVQGNGALCWNGEV